MKALCHGQARALRTHHDNDAAAQHLPVEAHIFEFNCFQEICIFLVEKTLI
jgi:hypothetical protein